MRQVGTIVLDLDRWRARVPPVVLVGVVPPWVNNARHAIDAYWRRHLARAELLARALAERGGAPAGWSWCTGRLRSPPLPYYEARFAPPAGHCRVCSQPVYRYGWHRDLWRDGAPNTRASWHACCSTAFRLWRSPSAYLEQIAERHGGRCAINGVELGPDAEVDHLTPLWRVWRSRASLTWPAMLHYWSLANLHVVSRAAHLRKCAIEAGERAGQGIAFATGPP